MLSGWESDQSTEITSDGELVWNSGALSRTIGDEEASSRIESASAWRRLIEAGCDPETWGMLGNPWTLILVVSFGLSPLLLVAWIAHSTGLQPALFTKDLAAIANLHPFSGALSSLGILFWAISAGLWLFAAGMHRTLKSRDSYWFCLSFGLLSAWLAFDDLFQFHESLAPRYLGISEKLVYAGLGLSVLTQMVLFRNQIAERGVGLFLLSLGLLGFSVVIDSIGLGWFLPIGRWGVLLEDGAKWLGIICWCAYAVAWFRGDLLARLHPRIQSD